MWDIKTVSLTPRWNVIVFVICMRILIDMYVSSWVCLVIIVLSVWCLHDNHTMNINSTRTPWSPFDIHQKHATKIFIFHQLTCSFNFLPSFHLVFIQSHERNWEWESSLTRNLLMYFLILLSTNVLATLLSLLSLSFAKIDMRKFLDIFLSPNSRIYPHIKTPKKNRNHWRKMNLMFWRFLELENYIAQLSSTM